MKRFSYLFIVFLLLIACLNKNKKSLQERSQDSVKRFLSIHLNDPSSYQPVGFDSLKQQISDYKYDDKYFEYNEWATNTIQIETDDMLKDFKLYKDRKAQGYYDKLKQRGVNGIDSLKKVFRPKLVGFRIYHTYRANNAFGALILHTMLFKLDTTLSVFDAKE